MDPLRVHQGDDRPSVAGQITDQVADTFVDLSPAATQVFGKFKMKGTTTVLNTVLAAKAGDGSTGWFVITWPTDIFDVSVTGNYELEILVSYGTTSGTITAATLASPVVITSATHNLTTGDEVHIESVAGMTELNDESYIVTVIDANTFSLDDINGTAFTAYTSGGTWRKITDVQTANRHVWDGLLDDDAKEFPIKVLDDF